MLKKSAFLLRWEQADFASIFQAQVGWIFAAVCYPFLSSHTKKPPGMARARESKAFSSTQSSERTGKTLRSLWVCPHRGSQSWLAVNSKTWTGEMARLLRALGAPLVGGACSQAPTWQLTATCNLCAREPSAPFWSPWAPDMCTGIHAGKTPKFLKFKTVEVDSDFWRIWRSEIKESAEPHFLLRSRPFLSFSFLACGVPPACFQPG